MLSKLQKNISSIANPNKKRFLLAISGGMDSVVLAQAFKLLEINFELAHCNFKLRGSESDGDQKFVENFAKQLNIPLYLKICDLSQTDENIQLAARNARYDWFKQLQKKHQFDYIVTAHHLDDSIETFFINLQRGTGLKGLLGIQNTEDILRPMLNMTRDEIYDFARQQKLTWRDDSSNTSDKYRRNFIRHHIIPKLKENKPDFYRNFIKTLSYLQQNQAITDEWFQQKTKELVTAKADIQKLDLTLFDKLQQKELFLFHWLHSLGFTDIKTALKLTTAQSGREIFSPTHRLTKHGKQLILQPKKVIDNNIYRINTGFDTIKEPISLKLSIFKREKVDIQSIYSASKNEIYIDYDLVIFPLILRKWQAGDYFYPLGMTGKKKVSDYLINRKISLPEKEKIYLLCNQNDIIWIVGHQLDNRYIITDKTKNILHIKITK